MLSAFGSLVMKERDKSFTSKVSVATFEENGCLWECENTEFFMGVQTGFCQGSHK